MILLANAHGEYLGAPSHEPLFAELNRRGAVVFVHPSTLPGPAVTGVPPFAADFLLDTTRAAYRLVQSGVIRRQPRLKIILAHAGGFLPYASHRLLAALLAEGRAPDESLEDLRSFWFDTALSGSPAALPSLLAFAKPGRVLFGSDWPYAPAPAVAYFTGQLDAYPALAADPAFHLDMEFRSGDVQWIKNSVVLHARTEYEDFPEPERKRHLLRLWLTSRRAFADRDAFLNAGIPKKEGVASDGDVR